jgi:hypothetical protein
MRKGRGLERVSGELVEREVVAHPVRPSGREQVPATVIYVQQPVAPAFEEPVRELVPPWLRVFAYALVIAFVIFATVSVMAGPPWAPDHQPAKPAHVRAR